MNKSASIYFFRVFLFLLSGVWFCPAQASPIISEVLYDAPGSDSGATFVELFGVPGTALDGYNLLGINGFNGSIYKSVPLSGLIPADGLFVIGDADSSGNTTVVNVDLIADVDFQNGPDSIILWDGEFAVDAVGYGDFTAAIFAGEGSPVADGVAGESIYRWNIDQDTDDNAVDFRVSGTPTPGTTTLFTVPLPGALWLFSSGILLAGIRMRRCDQTLALGNGCKQKK